MFIRSVDRVARVAKRWLNAMAFALSLSLPFPTLAQEAVWVLKSPMPTPRDEHASCAIGQYVYVMGGAEEEGRPSLATVDRYDSETDSWTSRQAMPTARQNLSASVVDGKCYAIGGESPQGAVVERYDPETNQWTVRASMPTARRGAASAVIDNIIYVVGGLSNGGDYLDTLEAYNPATDSWTTRAPMPTGRAFSTASGVGGKLYVMGGSEAFLFSVPKVEVYDPETNQWSTAAPMPSALFYLASSVVDGEIYTIGGVDSAAVHIYDPLTNTWAPGVPLPVSRNRHTSEVLGDEIYVFGGARNSIGFPHNTTDSVEAFRFEGETFNIDAGLNGNWWNGPPRDGEGAQVEVADAGDGELVFVVTVYSYAPQGGQIFLIGVGFPVGDTVQVQMFITSGGMWGVDFDPEQTPQTPWGSGVFRANSCQSISMTLTPNAEFMAMGYTVLSYDLIRLTTPVYPCPIENSN